MVSTPDPAQGREAAKSRRIALKAERRAALPPPDRVASLTIDDAMAVFGFGRTWIYKNIKLGNIRAFRAGRRRLVCVRSVRAHLGMIADHTNR